MKNINIFVIFILSLSLHVLNNSQIYADEQNQNLHEVIEKKSNITPGTIILLNGTSSAGKSTLLHALQKNHYPSFHIARIDDFIRTSEGFSMKNRYKNFYTYIRKIALSGTTVIVDTIAYQLHYEKYNTILKPCKVIKILVYCPLDALIVHVAQRNQLKDPREKRIINQAMAQFLTLYTIQNSPEDIIIDKITGNQIHDVVIKSQAMAKKSTWKKSRGQKRINQNLEKEFNLKASRSMSITPKHAWDFIVNTGIDSPENIAQKVVDFVEAQFA